MEPEENQNETSQPSEHATDADSSEVYRAEIAPKDTRPSDSGPEAVEAEAAEPSGREDDARSADLVEAESSEKSPVEATIASDSTASLTAGEQLWGDAELLATPSTSKPPFLFKTLAAKVSFGLAAAASVGFLIWFCLTEIQGPLGNLTVVRMSLLSLFLMFGALVGMFRVHRLHVPNDARLVAILILMTALISYLVLVPHSWRLIGFLWLLFQVAPVVFCLIAPKKEFDASRIRFNVNDSLAANGGAVGAVVLGIWSILGAMFSSISIVNAIMGMVLGLWGLTSPRKSLAILGLALCAMGIAACMSNVTVLFWEMWNVAEEEVL